MTVALAVATTLAETILVDLALAGITALKVNTTQAVASDANAEYATCHPIVGSDGKDARHRP
jgi:prephenate dehydrogenase